MAGQPPTAKCPFNPAYQGPNPHIQHHDALPSDPLPSTAMDIGFTTGTGHIYHVIVLVFAIIGFLAVIAITAFVVWYMRHVSRSRKLVATIQRKQDAEDKGTATAVGTEQAQDEDGAVVRSLTSQDASSSWSHLSLSQTLMDKLTKSRAKSSSSSSSQQDQVKIIGLNAYFDSLQIIAKDPTEGISTQTRMVATIVDHFGQKVLLPVIMAIVPRLLGMFSLHAILQLTPSPTVVVSMVELMLSYVDRVNAQNAVVDKDAQGAQDGKEEKKNDQVARDEEIQEEARLLHNVDMTGESTPDRTLKSVLPKRARNRAALHLLRDGDPLLPQLPNPFVLERDVDAVIALMDFGSIEDIDQVQQVPPPKKVSDLLPALHSGDGNLTFFETPREHARSRIVSAILNKLAYNHAILAELDEVDESSGTVFKVKLRESDSDVDSHDIETVADFVRALQESDHKVSVRFATDVTSFGVSLCVKNNADDAEKPDYTYIGIGFPCKTGIRTANGSRGEEIIVLLPHACIEFHVSGSILNLNAAIQCYQGTEGFTGFHSGQDVKREWQNVREVYVSHGPDRLHNSDAVTAMECFGLVSLMNNILAGDENLLCGGYLVLGTCVDTVALIQQVIFQRTTMFPLLLHGAYKSQMFYTLERFNSCVENSSSLSHRRKKRIMQHLAALCKALLVLPCDVTIEPQETIYACERIISTMPAKSPFVACQVAIEQAKVLLEQLMKSMHDTMRSRSVRKLDTEGLAVSPPKSSSEASTKKLVRTLEEESEISGLSESATPLHVQMIPTSETTIQLHDDVMVEAQMNFLRRRRTGLDG